MRYKLTITGNYLTDETLTADDIDMKLDTFVDAIFELHEENFEKFFDININTETIED